MSRPTRPRRTADRIIAVAAGIFGLVTILAAATVISGQDNGLAGRVVPFVVQANLVLGVVYVAAAALIWRESPKAAPLALAIAGATVLVALGFAYTAARGTPFEPRTVAALAFRAGVWGAIFWWLRREART